MDVSSIDKIDQWWLSPMSDHFPTPRGLHFLAAPILPSTPSGGVDADPDADDVSSVSSSSKPSTSNMGDRHSVATDATEFDMTPTTHVAMSPAAKSMMQAHHKTDVPDISAPPSLDGSLNSDEPAALSAPPTPSVDGADEDGLDWAGVVRLQPEALATLQALSGIRTVDEDHGMPRDMSETPRLPARLLPKLSDHAFAPSPSARRQSLSARIRTSLSQLDIPSPAGFFSGLSSASRRTWQSGASAVDWALPTSTTAEQFYKGPWASDTSASAPVVVLSPSRIGHDEVEIAGELVADELVTAASTGRPPQPPEDAITKLNRTEMWLMAQRNYMKGLAGVSDDGDRDAETAPSRAGTDTGADAQDREPPAPDAPGPRRRKTVRFSEPMVREAPSSPAPQESAYSRAFADAMVRVRPSDVFVHQQSRFEALQAQRVALCDMHRSQLLGSFQLTVVPPSAKKRMSANVARGDDELVDDPDKFRADEEAEALGQMSMAHWHVAANRLLLGGGRLVAAPVTERLARPLGHTRVLDLAGMGACDWAWHVALQYPHAEVYTVNTRAVIGQLSSSSDVGGPPNHRQVAVSHLGKLPFADAHFDLVSARELHAALKTSAEAGVDEWDACLQECMRVLKPGGYLDFSLLDADIVNAGPLGNAKAVELAFALRTLGFDPTPTRSFVARLRRAGFDGLRRAWLCLPMGPRPAAPRPVALEAMVSGSADGMAAVTGLAAGWTWERWLLRAEMDKAAGELRLAADAADAVRQAASNMIADVHAVVEEGRRLGSAFRLLRGYARKPLSSFSPPPAPPAPLERMGTIKMALDTDGLC